MPHRSLSPALALALAALASGCKPKPPPPPPTPEVVPEVKAPPKCETLQEKCAAAADSRAKIASSELVFTPPSSWIYAQFSSVTVAQVSETGPAVAFMGYEGDAKDAKKERAAREAALTELAKQLNLGAIKQKPFWNKGEPKAVGGLKLELWQIETGSRGSKKGPLLIVAGPTQGNKGVIGVGFVPDDDSSGADGAIMKSIESIGKGK